jgi:predicted TPR repeat methyltransferase
LGLLAMKHGLYDPAVAQFERVIALDPNRDIAKIDLCQAIYMLNAVDPERAKELACKARELHPQDPVVLRGTAGIVGESGITTDETIYTRELFDGFAQTFESKLGELGYSTPRHLANELGLGTGEAARNLDVLDAGCGTGLCGVYLRPVARTLVGVDLSPGMLRLAKDKNLYDALHEGGINEFLRHNVLAFDLIVFADVLVYFGDLLEVIESSFRSLRQAGRIAISVENMEDEASGKTFVLQASGRYAHSPNYIRQLLEHAGFSIEKFTSCTLRMENKKPIPGCIVIADKR